MAADVFCVARGMLRAAVVGEEENPDDAALDNKFTGIAATLPLLCICHAQFVNPGEETP